MVGHSIIDQEMSYNTIKNRKLNKLNLVLSNQYALKSPSQTLILHSSSNQKNQLNLAFTEAYVVRANSITSQKANVKGCRLLQLINKINK